MARELTTKSGRDLKKANGSHDVTAAQPRQVFRPPVDIYETADDMVLEVDMPGVPPDSVDVSLEQQVLTIKGRFSPVRSQAYQALHAEYAEGDYERAFFLSEDVERDRIEAAHKNGVLTLKLPKAAAAKTRKIAVKAA